MHLGPAPSLTRRYLCRRLECSLVCSRSDESGSKFSVRVISAKGIFLSDNGDVILIGLTTIKHLRMYVVSGLYVMFIDRTARLRILH